MKVLAIIGSVNHDGQTAKAAKALAKGVESAGGECELVFLTDLEMESCRQCDQNGWGLCLNEGRCVIEDDFARLGEMVDTADAVVFATPVYYGELSESMLAFLNRFRRVRRQRTGASSTTAAKKAVGICVAGGGGGGAPNCCVSLERILQHLAMDVVDMVPVRRQNLDMKLGILQITGHWLVEQTK